MKRKFLLKPKQQPIVFGVLVGIFTLMLTFGSALAAPSIQEDGPTATPTPVMKDCQECHLDVAKDWSNSLHAQAFNNEHFQEHWRDMDNSGNCLSCHTTNYLAATGEYTAEGVTCKACHNLAIENHPHENIPVFSGAEYCGKCHMKTLAEWRLSGHAKEDLGCTTCHDPHSQEVLYENPDDMCLECHEAENPEMTEHPDVLDDLEKIGCVDCHTVAVPHPFQQNHTDLSVFNQGFGCDDTVDNFTTTRFDYYEHASETLMPEYRYVWPIVHTVTDAHSSLECRDCHDSEEGLMLFSELGYPPERVEELTWSEFPEITKEHMSILVAQPKINQSWIGWLIGVLGVIAISEITVARKLKDDSCPEDEEETSKTEGC